MVILKYLEISFTSLGDLARIRGGNFSILAGLSVLFSFFFFYFDRISFESEFIWYLLFKRVLVLISKEQIPAWAVNRRYRFQAALPMSLSSAMSLNLLTLILLLSMYLVMWISNSLIHLESERKYFNELWREIVWKLPSYRSFSIDWLESYSSWMLITSSCGEHVLALFIVVLLPWGLDVLLRASLSCWTHYEFLVGFGLAALLTRLLLLLTLLLYDSWELSIGSTAILSRRLLLHSIFR